MREHIPEYMAPTRILVALMTAATLAACDSEKMKGIPEPLQEYTEQEAAADYLQLQAGHYWVYESYSVNLETGEEIPLHKRDSLYVLRDTLINRSRYFILEGTRLGQGYRSVIRCSGPEVMDAEGHLLFSTKIPGDTLPIMSSFLPADAWHGLSFTRKAEAVEVPFGQFDALENRQLFYFQAKQGSPAADTIRRRSDYFTKDIGLIKYSSYFPSRPLDIEMRLLRTNVYP